MSGLVERGAAMAGGNNGVGEVERRRVLSQFGGRLRQARQRAGLSQEELAARAGLDRTYVGGAERGERNVALVNIVRLASALSCAPADLIPPTVGDQLARRSRAMSDARLAEISAGATPTAGEAAQLATEARSWRKAGRYAVDVFEPHMQSNPHSLGMDYALKALVAARDGVGTPRLPGEDQSETIIGPS